VGVNPKQQTLGHLALVTLAQTAMKLRKMQAESDVDRYKVDRVCCFWCCCSGWSFQHSTCHP
jgi:hypothetical protein